MPLKPSKIYDFLAIKIGDFEIILGKALIFIIGFVLIPFYGKE